MQIDACLDKIPIGVDVITIRNRNDLENGFPKPTKIMDARCGHLGAADIDDQSLKRSLDFLWRWDRSLW